MFAALALRRAIRQFEEHLHERIRVLGVPTLSGEEEAKQAVGGEVQRHLSHATHT